MTQEQKNYNDALKDVLQAADSVEKLTAQQQEKLLQEFLEIKGKWSIYQMLQQFSF